MDIKTMNLPNSELDIWDAIESIRTDLHDLRSKCGELDYYGPWCPSEAFEAGVRLSNKRWLEENSDTQQQNEFIKYFWDEWMRQKEKAQK